MLSDIGKRINLIFFDFLLGRIYLLFNNNKLVDNNFNSNSDNITLDRGN